MLTFHLGSPKGELIGFITHAEEHLLWALQSSRIDFLEKLNARYYDDPSFSQTQLRKARAELLDLSCRMSSGLLRDWQPDQADLLGFVYKLVALVTCALEREQDLHGLSD